MCPKMTEDSKPQRGKNIKNIYVHKINSLMKISRDNLHEEDIEMAHKLQKNKIKRIRSEINKETLKLEKNRESARKARQRKKLYIKLLENQVEKLKQTVQRGQIIQKQGYNYLQILNKKVYESKVQTQFTSVDKYLSHDDLGQTKQSTSTQLNQRLIKMDKYIEEICQILVPFFLKNLQQLQESQNETQLPTMIKQSQLYEMESIQNMMKLIMNESQNIRKKFETLLKINQRAKKLIKKQYQIMKNEQIDELNLGNKDMDKILNFITRLGLCRMRDNEQQLCNNIINNKYKAKIFININETQNLLSKMETYIQNTQDKQQI